MPEPLSPKMGFGMKVAVLPAAHAVFLMMYLYFITLSAAVSSSENRVAISPWPAVPTSWWARSTLSPEPRNVTYPARLSASSCRRRGPGGPLCFVSKRTESNT